MQTATWFKQVVRDAGARLSTKYIPSDADQSLARTTQYLGEKSLRVISLVGAQHRLSRYVTPFSVTLNPQY